MLETELDPKLDSPPRRALRPFYLKALLAAVALLVVGSPGLAMLAELFAPGPWIWWWLEVICCVASIALLAGTLVVALIAAIRLRSQGREASRSYGVSAVLAAAMGLVFAAPKVLWFGYLFLRSPFVTSQFWANYLYQTVSIAVECSAVAVTTAWLILALTGVGRRVSSGFERLCLGFGLLWILAYVARYVLEIAPWLR
jgi:hypothetical protein